MMHGQRLRPVAKYTAAMTTAVSPLAMTPDRPGEPRHEPAVEHQLFDNGAKGPSDREKDRQSPFVADEGAKRRHVRQHTRRGASAQRFDEIRADELIADADGGTNEQRAGGT